MIMFLHTKDFHHKPYNIHFHDSGSGEGATKIFKHANTRGIDGMKFVFRCPEDTKTSPRRFWRRLVQVDGFGIASVLLCFDKCGVAPTN